MEWSLGQGARGFKVMAEGSNTRGLPLLGALVGEVGCDPGTEAQGGDSDTPSGEGPAPQPHTQPAHEVRLWASPVTPARACAAARTAGVAVPLALELAWAGSPELLWTWFCSWVELLSWL